MSDWTPQDEAFAQRVRESFNQQNMLTMMGACLDTIEAGRVEISLPFREDLTQQHGFLHAGALTTILDVACGYAAYSLMPADAGVLSVEFKTNLLAPAVGESMVARASVKRSGRTLTVCQADAFMRQAGEEKLVATMLATMITIHGEGRRG